MKSEKIATCLPGRYIGLPDKVKYIFSYFTLYMYSKIYLFLFYFEELYGYKKI